MKAKKLMAMGLAVTLCVSATACGKNKETTQVSKVSVEVENPQMGELTSDTTYIGTVEPQQQVYVMPHLVSKMKLCLILHHRLLSDHIFYPHPLFSLSVRPEILLIVLFANVNFHEKD